jgi:hypothetical protein
MNNYEGWHEHVGPGWKQLVDVCVAEAVRTNARIVQVKEKFGALRFYYDNGDADLDQAVNAAETLSGFICETCGAPGIAHTHRGWIKIRCPACIQAIEKTA